MSQPPNQPPQQPWGAQPQHGAPQGGPQPQYTQQPPRYAPPQPPQYAQQPPTEGLPPQQPPPKEKTGILGWATRHKVLSVIIVIVLLGIIVNLASGGDDNKAAGPAETPAATQTASDPAETEPGETATEDAPADETPEAPADETPEAPAAGLGDPVTSGDWTFTVSKVSDPVAKIGDEHFNTQAHGEFILMDVSITNEGDSAAYLMANQIKLTSGGKTFESSSDAAFYMGDAAVPIFDEINPGLTVEGKIAFDVPKGTAPEQVLFNGGLFADDAAISLK